MTETTMPHARPVSPIPSGGPDTVRQASTNTGDIWAGDVEHSPGYLAAIQRGENIGELRRRSAEDALARAIRAEHSPVMYETPAWCGKGGCRPASPCPNCAGRTQVVRDNTAADQPPAQTSVIRSPWEPDPPAMAEAAARDAVLGQMERQHATAMQAHQTARDRAMAEQVAEFMIAREHAPQVPGREPPTDVLKGL